ncbi:MAG: glycosyltransferase family 2 protein [Candidatus Sumerlaeia bacterium]|nr:glycosyltransferase family 2 protein [Candidatus Sumerlaeia bacterium]
MPNGSSPIVSIITPLFQRGHCARVYVDSLQRQTVTNWEALLIDDGSKTEELLLWLQAIGDDERFQIIPRSRDPKGANTCRNLGTEKARGEYVIYLDCDDALGDAVCLEERLKGMEQNPEVDFVVSSARVFINAPGDTPFWHNKRTSEEELGRFLTRDIAWQTTGPTWRKASLQKVLPWDERLPSWQDWDFHVRALLKGLRYEWLEGGITYWRNSSNSISKSIQQLDHVVVIEELLKEMTTRIVETEGVEAKHQRAMVRNLYWAAADYRKNSQNAKAGEVLNWISGQKVMGTLEHKLLVLHAQTYHVPIVGKLLRPIVALFCGKQMLIPMDSPVGKVR